MLVLQRNKDESVTIIHPDGTHCVLTICAIDRGKVRIGFVAPKEVRIYRNEVLHLINQPPPEKAAS